MRLECRATSHQNKRHPAPKSAPGGYAREPTREANRATAAIPRLSTESGNEPSRNTQPMTDTTNKPRPPKQPARDSQE